MIGNIGGSSASVLMPRPDSSSIANSLFSKLDTKNQGYIEKGDIQSAFDQMPGSANALAPASVDDVFARLDGNGDGRVTELEMSDSLSKLIGQFESQFNNMRTRGMGGMRGMNGGLSKEELGAMVEELGAVDSQRADRMANLAANFDTADSDGDGKVSLMEARAFNQASAQTGLSASAFSGDSATASGDENTDARVMIRIMQLVRAYGGLDQATAQAEADNSFSIVA